MEEESENAPLLAHKKEVKEINLSKQVSVFERFLNRRPKYVELGYFMYYLASTATTPLVEQFSKAEIDKGYDNYKSYLKFLYPKYYAQDDLELGADPPDICDPSNYTSALDSILEESIQVKASMWLLFLDLALTVPAVFSTLLICSYGDHNGRKLGLVLSSAGGAIRTCIFILTITLELPSILYLVASFIDGLSGSSLTFAGSCLAYIADTSSKEKRAIRFIILQSLNTFASTAANLGMGYMIDSLGYTAAFWIVAFVHIFNTLYIIFLIPDSKSPNTEITSNVQPSLRRRRSSLQLLKDGTLHATKRAFGSFSVLTEKTPLNYGRLKLGILLSAFIFNVLIALGTSAAKTLFMLAPPFCWNSIELGYYNAITSFTHGVFGLLGVWILTKYIKESTIAIIGSVSTTLGTVFYGFAQNALMLYIVIVIMLANNVVIALIRAIMSKLVDPSRQGALFATVFSIETLCDVCSGAMLNAIYGATLHFNTGIVFFVSAGFYGISTVLLCVYYCIEKKTAGTPHTSNETQRAVPLLEESIEVNGSSKLHISESAPTLTIETSKLK